MEEEVVKTVKIGKIKDLISQTRKPAQQSNVAEPKEKIETVKLKDATEMEVKQVFADFVQDLYKRNQKSLAAYMSDPIFSFGEGKISLTVGSKTLKNELEEEVKTLGRMFRKRGLNFPGFDLKIDALKVKEYKPFTPKEQFNAAAKDHPILKDFADRFGLDFDV